MGEVEGDSGGEGGIDREGEAGEVDEGGDGSGDEGGVAGVLFEALDEAADAVVVAADFLLETFFEDGPEVGVGGIHGLGGSGFEVDQVFDGGFKVVGVLEPIDHVLGVWVGDRLAVGGEVEHGGEL